MASTSTDTSQSSAVSQFLAEMPNPSIQNRKKWPNLARICERYQLSDRAAAAVANSVLVDVGLVTEDDKTRIIDRSKLRRKRERCRNEIRSKEQQNFGLVNAVYLDGRKDATQIVAQGPNEKHYRSVQLEEHYTVVGEPGSYYLTHFSPEDGKGRTIAQKLFDSFSGTELEGKLAIVGTDGTASMTGKHNGCIRSLEELLHRPLQWVVCLLHTNELPLRHVFAALDGATSGPDTFAGPIGKKILGPVSSWPVTQFKQVFVPISSFPKLPPHVIDDLSTDQYYAYKICLAIITGNCDDDLQYLEVGPVVHSRWLTSGCRILRYYVSLDEPPQNLEILVNFCLTVYFPTWFEINLYNQLTHGSKVFFSLIKRINSLTNQDLRQVAQNVVQRNGYFGHPESILIAMLGDDDQAVRDKGVNHVLSLRKNDTSVRLFHLPTLNLEADTYYELADLEICQQQPPAIRHLSDSEIEDCRMKPLILHHPCHNQTVERHVKLVTEASAQVTGFERRDGLIRQKIRSRKLLKKFETKMQFS